MIREGLWLRRLQRKLQLCTCMDDSYLDWLDDEVSTLRDGGKRRTKESSGKTAKQGCYLEAAWGELDGGEVQSWMEERRTN